MSKYVSRTLRSRRAYDQQRASDRKAKALIAVSLAGFVGFVIGGANFVKNPPAEPATRVVKVYIGTGCPMGEGPGSQVVGTDLGDEAFDGCKSIDAHDFVETQEEDR